MSFDSLRDEFLEPLGAIFSPVSPISSISSIFDPSKARKSFNFLSEALEVFLEPELLKKLQRFLLEVELESDLDFLSFLE